MLEKGLSCSFELTKEVFEGLKKADIKNVELSYRPDDIGNINYQEVSRLSKEYGVNLWSFHLPFWGYTPIDAASHDEDVRNQTVELWKNYIKLAGEIGIKKFIAHPSAEPKSEDEKIRAKEIEYSMDTLAKVAEYAQTFGAVVCVENLPRTCLGRNAEELLKITSAHPNLKICFDTNHLLMQDTFEFIDLAHEKIATLHVSDYDYVDERHWLPGEGKVDWHKVYNKLISYGYNGAWLYEIGIKTRPNIIKRSRDLTFEDFERNANEIFEGKPLTVIG